jgi:hypothetical protein
MAPRRRFLPRTAAKPPIVLHLRADAGEISALVVVRRGNLYEHASPCECFPYVCLSRACLGKMMAFFVQNGIAKDGFYRRFGREGEEPLTDAVKKRLSGAPLEVGPSTACRHEWPFSLNVCYVCLSRACLGKVIICFT